MIQGPPFQNATPPTNKRLRALIIGAQIFSVFAFLGILVIFSWTIKQVTRRNKEHLQTEITNDMNLRSMTDSTPVVTETPSNSPTDEALFSEAEIQKNINESLYEVIKINTPDSTYNKDEVLTSLPLMKKESAEICGQLENLYRNFKDTLDQAGVSDISYTTEKFFVDSGRDRQLKDDLKNYREGVINRLVSLNFQYVNELRTSMPLDDTNSSGYVVAWDPGKFSGNPSDALSYLRELEVEVRNFEAAALNKYPQTITH